MRKLPISLIFVSYEFHSGVDGNTITFSSNILIIACTVSCTIRESVFEAIRVEYARSWNILPVAK